MLRIILQLFWTYLQIGAFTIGGGYVMLAYVQREIVDKRHWIAEKEFLNMLALAQTAPGLIAVNTAIFVGWGVAKSYIKASSLKENNVWQQKLFTTNCILAAILGAIIPSIGIILIIAVYFSGYKSTPTMEAIFKGVRPAVISLIAATVIRLARKI